MTTDDISPGQAFSLVRELMGEAGMWQLSEVLAERASDPEAARAADAAALERAHELLDMPGDGVLPSRDESVRDLSALAYLVHVEYTVDLAKAVAVAHLALRAAYHLGVADAKLQVFGDAVAEADEGE
jgi:hypothetical protein